MSDQITAELLIKLMDATSDFGEAYTASKRAEKASKSCKEDFYEVANEHLSLRRLPQKTIQIKGGDEVAQHVADYFPGWRPVASDPSQEEGMIDVIIEQDPAQMKYSFVNLENGEIYQRTYVDGSPRLDEGRLQEEDPDLYDDLHDWPPPPSWLFAFAQGFNEEGLLEEAVVDDWYDFLENGTHDVEPILKPSSEWTKEQASAVQKYLTPGKRTMKIVAPRDATDEEIAEATALLQDLVEE